MNELLVILRSLVLNSNMALSEKETNIELLNVLEEKAANVSFDATVEEAKDEGEKETATS